VSLVGTAPDPSGRILMINGSPSRVSKTAAVVRVLAERLAAAGAAVDIVSVRDFPAEELAFGNAESPAIRRFLEFVALSRAIVVATPIYKASYTGVLKALLDTIPPGSFANKTVLPLATAGTLAHYLALDYALRPVLTFLGARDILPNLFLTDGSFQDALMPVFDDAIEERIGALVRALLAAVASDSLQALK
jgi:FMN reductase